MPYFEKHFTVDEANRLIPRIRDIFAEVQTLAGTLHSHTEPVSMNPESPLHAKVNGRANGHAHTQRKQDESIRNRINLLLTEITDHGIVIQDFQRGLIDFPSFIDSEEVFLCYELADGDTVQFWHHLEAGYAGRNPID